MGTFVQANRGYESGSDNSFLVAYNTNVVSGNLLVVTIGAYHATATINTPTDTLGTTYVQAGTLLRGTGSTPVPFLGVWYGIAPSSGANTTTAVFSAAVTDKEIKVFEWSGIDTTTSLNQTNGTAGQTATGAQTLLSGQIITTLPGPILKVVQEWSWVAHSEAAGTPTTGWTEFGDTATGADSAYRNETGTGTFNGGFSLTSIDNNAGYCCRIVAFADASAPGGPTVGELVAAQSRLAIPGFLSRQVREVRGV